MSEILRVKIQAEKSFRSETIDILIRDRTTGAVAQPPTFTPPDPGQYADPTFRLDDTAAQQLMDELWNCGVRPTAGKGSAGQLAAVQAHLADMQKIAMGFSAVALEKAKDLEWGAQ